MQSTGPDVDKRLVRFRFVIFPILFIFIYFILFYKIRRTKQILNLYKYLRVHWLGLTTEIVHGAGCSKLDYANPLLKVNLLFQYIYFFSTSVHFKTSETIDNS